MRIIKAGNFGITWLLELEGSPEEEIRTNLGSPTFFFKGDEGFGGSTSGTTSPAALSYESIVCSRVSS
jgi:hypothetical protein